MKARRTVDASDKVVTPGFIDPRIYYDAQILWDGGVNPAMPLVAAALVGALNECLGTR